MIAYIIMAVIAYCIGSINFSVLISRKMAGFDVREKGSGNAGTTNMLRSVGKKAAALTLLCDILKGVVAILLARLMSVFVKSVSPAVLVEIAALAVVIGHTFPIFFEFRGGKGVATSLGVLFMINWKIGLICLVFGVALIAITRMVSLGSISAAVLFAVLVLFFRDSYIVAYEASYIIFSFLMAGFVIFNHRSNIKRIAEGNENRISFKKKETNQENETAKNPKDDEVKISEEIKIDVKKKK